MNHYSLIEQAVLADKTVPEQAALLVEVQTKLKSKRGLTLTVKRLQESLLVGTFKHGGYVAGGTYEQNAKFWRGVATKDQYDAIIETAMNGSMEQEEVAMYGINDADLTAIHNNLQAAVKSNQHEDMYAMINDVINSVPRIKEIEYHLPADERMTFRQALEQKMDEMLRGMGFNGDLPPDEEIFGDHENEESMMSASATPPQQPINSEDNEMSDEHDREITEDDYKQWLEMTAPEGTELSRVDFMNTAHEVLDNDPKMDLVLATLSSRAAQTMRRKIVTVLWQQYQAHMSMHMSRHAIRRSIEDEETKHTKRASPEIHYRRWLREILISCKEQNLNTDNKRHFADCCFDILDNDPMMDIIGSDETNKRAVLNALWKMHHASKAMKNAKATHAKSKIKKKGAEDCEMSRSPKVRGSENEEQNGFIQDFKAAQGIEDEESQSQMGMSTDDIHGRIARLGYMNAWKAHQENEEHCNPYPQGTTRHKVYGQGMSRFAKLRQAHEDEEAVRSEQKEQLTNAAQQGIDAAKQAFKQWKMSGTKDRRALQQSRPKCTLEDSHEVTAWTDAYNAAINQFLAVKKK